MATSTPDIIEISCIDTGCSPDLSIIEQPPSPPILIDESIDLQEDKRNCSLFSSIPLPNDSSSSGSSSNTPHTKRGQQDSQNYTDPNIIDTRIELFNCLCSNNPQTNSSTQTSRICLKTKKEPKHVHIQIPETEREDQECCECHDEFLNTSENKNYDSETGGRCVEEWKYHRKAKKLPPCVVRELKNEDGNCLLPGIKDSSGACSLVESVAGSSDGNTRATYYHSKLLSTLQILQNKEETIRVQAESLAVAEERIVALTERSAELRKDLERKTKELQALQKTFECKTEKTDVSITDVEDQSVIVSTLQNNLNVIEDLYRECFYETAKQEDLIDILRKSYLDMRLMDKRKEYQIGKLQTVINTQKWSLDRCQDMALEVDNLKMEIANFLSNSTPTNNDSGMWERSEESFASVPGVQEELQDIMEQLLTLRELLTADCTFDYEAENKKLKLENDALTTKITELCERNCELEQIMMSQNSREEMYEEEMKIKEQQMKSVRQELKELIEKSSFNNNEYETLTLQLQQTQVLVSEKNVELEKMQQQCASQQATITELRQDLNKAERIYEENCKIRSEVSYLTSQVSQWRQQLEDSEERVRMLDDKLRHAQASYREKEKSVSELQGQLHEAHARGAALCGDARRALCSVRHWAARMRDRHREHQNRIKEKDDMIALLQQQLDEHQSSSAPSGHCVNTSIDEPTCSKCLSHRPSLYSRRSQSFGTSTTEMASCSSAPIRPRRHLKKNSICGDTRCPAAPWLCDSSTQQPTRQDEYVDPRTNCCGTRREHNRRDMSPIEEVFNRVEQLSEALADGYRRWTRPNPR